ncbi:MAG: class I SAM-dependent methyltransferase [Acidobacteria bacterium]|nr:class I SAM-dependent methyltransferase [Acidobacteriota bacterium]
MATINDVATYWDRHIHDLAMTSHPVGSREFFADLAQYRYEKLHYLPRLVDFAGYGNRRLLELGCGIGTDLVRFARGGAMVTGLDLSERAIALARANVRWEGLDDRVDLRVGNAEALPFANGTFDIVYGHGVVQYTVDPDQMLSECRRVLAPGGEAIFMVYNRVSWLNLLSHVMRVELEHADAPVLRMYSIGEFRRLLSGFREVRIVPERFPVRSRLHGGWKGSLYNGLFVRVFTTLPRTWVERYGWHLMAFCSA